MHDPKLNLSFLPDQLYDLVIYLQSEQATMLNQVLDYQKNKRGNRAIIDFTDGGLHMVEKVLRKITELTKINV